MAGESELVIVAAGDTPDGARWQVMAGGTADEYLHAWKVISVCARTRGPNGCTWSRAMATSAMLCRSQTIPAWG